MGTPAATDPAASHDDWDQHWDDYSGAAEDNPAQRYRRRLALSLLERGGQPVRLLDLGSGQGDFLLAAAQRWPNAELLGVEPSEVGVRVSRGKVPGARFEAIDVTQPRAIPEDLRGWATHAVCSEVFEHVDDDLRLLRAATSLLAPGCRIVITIPGGRMSAFDRHIGHRRHYTPDMVAELLQGAGFDVEQATGAGFPFFNLYRSVVIARGDKLVDDVAAASASGKPGIAARAAMLAFRPLFRLNAPASARGVQMVGVGTYRAS